MASIPRAARATPLIASASCCICATASRLVKLQFTSTLRSPWARINVTRSPIRSASLLNRSVSWVTSGEASCGVVCSSTAPAATPALRSTAPCRVVATWFFTTESTPAPPPERARAPPRAAATGMASTLPMTDRLSTAPATRWRWACSADRCWAGMAALAPSLIVTVMLLSMRLLFWAAPTARETPEGLKVALRAPPSVLARLTWLSPVAVMIRSPPEISVLPVLFAAMAWAIRESLKAPATLPLTKPVVRAILTGTAIAS